MCRTFFINVNIKSLKWVKMCRSGDNGLLYFKESETLENSLS